MKKMSFDEAVRIWVREFNAIPQALIEKAYEHEIYEHEVTPYPKKYECDDCNRKYDKETYENDLQENEYGDKICLSCDEGFVYEEDDYENVEYGLPMWGTMWTFGSSLDSEWARNNLDVMADAGFKIFETDELGIFFGINGAGYDFYEAHWNKLYIARGLKWHNEEE